jgi:hypothetical protein
MTPFLKLEDLLAPLPLPPLIAVLMVLGLVALGRRLVRLLNFESPEAIHYAAGFVLSAAFLAAASHFIALVGLAYIWPLRLAAWCLAALGLMHSPRIIREWLLPAGQQIKALFETESAWGRAALLLLGLMGVALLLAALGPATDADSLDYHLGVPLEVLRQHGIVYRPDWFLARLAGLGEYLNLLGLAGGTDNFGAALQYAGLLAALAAVLSLAGSRRDQILLAMAVLACPLVVNLVPSQKPQMLPAAGLTIALVLLARRFPAMDLKTLVLALGCAFFATALKHSFLLSAAIVVAAGLWAAGQARLLPWALAAALAWYLILPFPWHWQNYWFYGDPLSPFLERFRTHGDPVLIQFAALKNYYAPQSLPRFVLQLFLPLAPREIPKVLGLGSLLLVAALGEIKKPGPARIMLLSALVLLPATLVLAHLGARYLWEPYLWSCAAAGAAPWGRLKQALFKIMVGQTLVMAVIAGYGAATLFPGSLSPAWRSAVMTRTASEYAEMRWLDQVLPPDAVVVSELRSAALLPRPFISRDIFAYDLANPGTRSQVRALLKAHRANFLIAYFPLTAAIRQLPGLDPTSPLAGPREFAWATRNPFARGDHLTRIAVYRLKPE